MTHPIGNALVDNQPVSKNDFRQEQQSRVGLVLENATEIQALELTTTGVVGVAGVWFAYDETDTVSAHDGVNVLVSTNGRRYRRIETLADLTAALIVALLGHGGLPVTALAPGAQKTVLGMIGGTTPGWIPGGVVADILDAALGSAGWRTGVFDIAIGSLVKALPANSKSGMIGGRVRMMQMADDAIRVGGAGTGKVNGTASNVGTARRIGFPSGFELDAGKFYAGTHAGYAIDADGYPWSWGDNQFGALGHGHADDLSAPKRIEWFVTNSFKVAKIVPIMPGADARNIGCYFLEDGGSGRVAYAGYHGSGNAGDGTATGSGNKTTPALAQGLTNVTDLFASCQPTTVLARRSDGSWRGWGSNASSCLGIAGSNFTSPQTLSAMAGWVKAMCSGAVTIALTDTGAVKTAGLNNNGSLGVGDTSSHSGWQNPTGLGSDVVDIAITQEDATVCAVIQLVSGLPTVKLWGYGGTGQLGNGGTSNQTSPYTPVTPWQGTVDEIVLAGENGNTINVGASYVRCGNRIHAAGYNGNGNLGIGIAGGVSSFAEVVGHVGTIVDWAVMGYYAYFGLIVLTDHGCYSGGENDAGDACIGPSFVDAPTLQDIWVPTAMGPAGQPGASFAFDQIGTFAARPGAGSVPIGWRYVATDTVPTATLYIGDGATWSTGIPIFQGLAGADGRTVHNGTGAPDPGLGEDGDLYLDTLAIRLYGPKSSGDWGLGVSLIGTDGLDGFFTGAEALATSADDADFMFFQRASDDAPRKIAKANLLGGVAGGIAAEQELINFAVALKLADLDNGVFISGLGDRIADSFDGTAFLDLAGSTDMDTATAGLIRPTVVAGTRFPAQMTSNSAPAGYVATASSIFGAGYEAYRAYDRVLTGTGVGRGWFTPAGTATGWNRIQIPAGQAAATYTVRCPQNASDPTAMPKNWTIRGSNNGVSWDIQDTRVNESGWSIGEERTYTIAAPASYTYCEIDITANNGHATLGICELAYYTAALSNNMAAKTATFIAAGLVQSAKMAVAAKLSGATLNTDLIAKASRDAGTTHSSFALTPAYALTGGFWLYRSDIVDLTGQPAGSSPKFEFVTANNKAIEIDGYAAYWKV